jgi:hypothetical protein
MSQLDSATQLYNDLKAEMEEHKQKEPIGLGYTKGDTYYWTKLFHEIFDELKNAEANLNFLLDEQLSEYLSQEKTIHWDKAHACLLLKERLGLQFNVSIKELFLYIGRSVICIPDQYKEKVINDFAHTLDEWASVDIDALRDAVHNIGFKIQEHCYHCNEIMSEFEGTGHPVCSDCI